MTQALTLVALAVVASCIGAAVLHVPKSECRSLLDVCFILDASDSINEANYDKQRQALLSIVKKLVLGPDRARVSIVVFSTNVAEAISFTHNKTELNLKIPKLPHSRDGTHTDKGIARMIKMFKETGRPDVPMVGVVITDGQSKIPKLTKKQAKLAKDMNVNMFAVGITNLINRTELLAIASNPNQVLELATFDQLEDSLINLMTVICPCPVPPEIPFAKINKGGRAIGMHRQYTCLPGYQAMGDGILECLGDAVWSQIVFSCEVCIEPDPIDNAVDVPGDVLVGTIREYVCKKGFTTPITLAKTCVETPVGPRWTDVDWKGLPPACLPCDVPIAPPNSFPVKKQTMKTLIGETWAFECDVGYIPSDVMVTTCIDNKGIAEWTPILGQCITCHEPPNVLHATVDAKGGVLVNAIRKYACLDGYHPSGVIEAICIGANGTAYWQVTDHHCITCQEPDLVPNGRLETVMSHLVGTVLVYQCLDGFQATGPIDRVCVGKQGKTFWDGPYHTCVACDLPPVIANAYLETELGDTLVGTVRNYLCVEGFIRAGPIQVACMKGKNRPHWTTEEFGCIQCDLPLPDHVPNGIMLDIGDNRIGSIRQFDCLPGYVPSFPGHVLVKCVGEYINDRGLAYWGEPSHQCIACPEPPAIDNGDILPGKNLVGSERRYKCRGQFHETGPIIVTCLANATWSKSPHSCRACGPLKKVPFATEVDGPVLIDSVRWYKCHDGYVASAEPTVICRKNATWSPIGFSCGKCPKIYTMENAVAEPGLDTLWSVRTYTCLPGYVQTGTINTTCSIVGKYGLPDWSTPVNYCRDCGPPHPVALAIPVAPKWTVGSTAFYECEPGFTPLGQPHSYCMKNGAWTVPEFKCIRQCYGCKGYIPPKKPKKTKYWKECNKMCKCQKWFLFRTFCAECWCQFNKCLNPCGMFPAKKKNMLKKNMLL